MSEPGRTRTFNQVAARLTSTYYTYDITYIGNLLSIFEYQTTLSLKEKNISSFNVMEWFRLYDLD